MNFEQMKDFIETKMKMSHIYQPLLIKCLIEAGGSATIRQLAIQFLTQDESQIMYYEKRLKEMPIRVLKRHQIIDSSGELISLNAKKLTLEQKAEIKKICESKIQEYIVARGLCIWDYRLLDNEPMPDSLRYRILSEANSRCALCGATKDDRPLDIDHILPRSKGGKTVYENLQVLCSKCNRSKRDTDNKDFRSIERGDVVGCVFCELSKGTSHVLENEYAFVIADKYPVTEGHSLVIPKRHFADYFSIAKVEKDAIDDLLQMRRKQLIESDCTIQGFNVGVNAGEVAGQTVFHCHIHLIPRRKGDVEDPQGGVRGVIPQKMSYKKHM